MVNNVLLNEILSTLKEEKKYHTLRDVLSAIRPADLAELLREVPEDATAVGIPARIVRIKGKKVNYASQVDQIHVSDPVQQELCQMRKRLAELEKKLGIDPQDCGGETGRTTTEGAQEA